LSKYFFLNFKNEVLIVKRLEVRGKKGVKITRKQIEKTSSTNPLYLWLSSSFCMLATNRMSENWYFLIKNSASYG
jgi:hypothetical protein